MSHEGKPVAEQEMMALMAAFMQSSQRAAELALSGSGVSPAQYFILEVLARHGPQDQRQIAEFACVTAGGISQLLAKLERASLVTRSAAGRRKVVSVTPAGRRLLARLGPSHDAFLRARFRSLGEPARRGLISALRLLNEQGAER
jgi:DNA-binding MarR family transcriptional regulator